MNSMIVKPVSLAIAKDVMTKLKMYFSEDMQSGNLIVNPYSPDNSLTVHASLDDLLGVALVLGRYFFGYLSVEIKK